jgi:hypothetical protein
MKPTTLETDMQDFQIITRATAASFENPNPTTFRLEFVKNGINYGGRTYNKLHTSFDEAKADFIKWCGY